MFLANAIPSENIYYTKIDSYNFSYTIFSAESAKDLTKLHAKMLLFPKLQCLFCTIITICTLNTLITFFLHN